MTVHTPGLVDLSNGTRVAANDMMGDERHGDTMVDSPLNSRMRPAIDCELEVELDVDLALGLRNDSGKVLALEYSGDLVVTRMLVERQLRSLH
jgi:hypothetical protein